MKRILLTCFALLIVLKFCASCDNNNSADDYFDIDTSKPPLTDTLGTDSIVVYDLDTLPRQYRSNPWKYLDSIERSKQKL